MLITLLLLSFNPKNFNPNNLNPKESIKILLINIIKYYLLIIMIENF